MGANIGQGNAVLVRTATLRLLCDAGPHHSLESDACHRVLVPLLRALGEQLDLLVLIHRGCQDGAHCSRSIANFSLHRAAVRVSVSEGVASRTFNNAVQSMQALMQRGNDVLYKG